MWIVVCQAQKEVREKKGETSLYDWGVHPHALQSDYVQLSKEIQKNTEAYQNMVDKKVNVPALHI